MRYNSSGYYEEKISLLGLGSEYFQMDEKGLSEKEKCAEIFKTAFEKGITFFFSPFSPDEITKKCFGENLSRKNRGDYCICGGISLDDVTFPNNLPDFFEKQLSALKTGFFDYYVIDGVLGKNDLFLENKQAFQTLRELKALGKIKHLGLSIPDSKNDYRAVLDEYPWDFVLMKINFYSWDYLGADEIYHAVRKKDIPFIASDPYFGGMILNPPREVFDIFQEGDPLYSMREWALRWFFNKKGLLCIISDPETAEELSETADIVSESKTLNSSKKHYVKLAVRELHQKNCGSCSE